MLVFGKTYGDHEEDLSIVYDGHGVILNMSFVVLFPALLLQVLTRAEQLAAKKKAKSGAAEPEQEDKGNQGNKGATSDDNDSGDDFGCPTGFMKRPAARGRPPKAKATPKAAAKSKAKALIARH